MSLHDMFEAYAEMNNTTIPFVRDQYHRGNILPFELFDAYLQHEGIFGYTQSIVTAFRICYNLDGINDL